MSSDDSICPQLLIIFCACFIVTAQAINHLGRMLHSYHLNLQIKQLMTCDKLRRLSLQSSTRCSHTQSLCIPPSYCFVSVKCKVSFDTNLVIAFVRFPPPPTLTVDCSLVLTPTLRRKFVTTPDLTGRGMLLAMLP